MKFRFGAIALALLLVVVAAGCGSKKKPSAAATLPATTTSASSSSGNSSSSSGSTTTNSTTTSSTTTNNGSSSSSSAPSFADTKNCKQLVSLGQKFSAAIQAASGSGSAAAVANEVKLFKALADASPSDIRGDFETIADAFATSATALQKAGITAGKTPTPKQLLELEAASKSFSSAKVQAASKNLEAWATKNCGGLTTTS